MADNLSITQGSGTTVATDEISSVHYQKVKLVLGENDVATLASYASGVPDGGTLRVAVAGCTSKGTQNFNRPSGTTPDYSIGDNISDNATAGSVTKMVFTLDSIPTIIRRVRVRKSVQGTTATIRVWMWDTSFTVGSGDNAAFSHPLQDAIGYVDVDVTNTGSDDAVGWTNCDIPNYQSGTIYCLLQTMTAFTPGASETFTVSIWYLNA